MPSLFDSPEFNGTLFYPRADHRPPPPGAEDERVPVPGGALGLRWHAAAGARFTLLLFHGNGETAADYDQAAFRFAGCGAALVVADYRGYGLGEGEPTYRGTFPDSRAAARAVLARSSLPLVVMGRSLGSSYLAGLYAEPPEGTAAFIWESGFTDLNALVARRGMAPPKAFPMQDLSAFDPLPKLARGRLPFLALHGAADVHIHPDESRAAFEAAGSSRKRMVLVPDRGHNDLSASPHYWQAIADFLREGA